MTFWSRRKRNDIQRELVDIHCHIIPGVDDGSHSESQSHRMLDVAWKNGFTAIIATPHYVPEGRHPSADKLLNLIDELQDYADEQYYDITIYEGNEIYYHEEVPKLLKEGKILTLAGSSYVLVEFSPADDARYIRNALASIQSVGYNPIIAHVERYVSLCRKPYDYIKELRNMGVLIQVNAGSIAGKMGYMLKNVTRDLLKKQWVDFVATDAHSDYGRSHAIEDCVGILQKKYPLEYVESILGGNARRLLLEI